MENSVPKISKALLDLASVADAVLLVTPAARAALKSAKLDTTQRSLLERIDGFRSLEQVLAMSGDLIAVHAALGKLMAGGLVATDSPADAAVAAPARVVAPAIEKKIATPPPTIEKKVAPPVPANEKRVALPATVIEKRVTPPPPAIEKRVGPATPAKTPPAELEKAKRLVKAPSGELENAKLLLLHEVKMALGKGAEKLRPRIDTCNSIEEIYDLIVKIQEYLTSSGKANPAVFLERLSTGLATARQKSSAVPRAWAQ